MLRILGLTGPTSIFNHFITSCSKFMRTETRPGSRHVFKSSGSFFLYSGIVIYPLENKHSRSEKPGAVESTLSTLNQNILLLSHKFPSLVPIGLWSSHNAKCFHMYSKVPNTFKIPKTTLLLRPKVIS